MTLQPVLGRIRRQIARRRRHRQTRNAANPKRAEYERSQPALTPEAFLIYVKLSRSL
jgi:hypothetical protein